MSKYTTEVRFICETNAGLFESGGESDVEDIIRLSREKIFNFNYPIFDEKYKSVLESKILRHYYTREIGLETVGLWKLKLNTKLNEIMPYYNQLYKSELLQFNPLYDFEVTRTHLTQTNGTKNDNGTNSTNSTSTSTMGVVEDYLINTNVDENSTNNNNTVDTITGSEKTTKNDKIDSTVTDKTDKTISHQDAYSETPQGSLTNIKDLKYLTNARIITDTDKQNKELITKENNTTNNEVITKNNTTSDTSSSSERSNIGKETGTRTTDTSTTNNSNISGLTSNNSVITNTEDYLENVKGKQGGSTYSEMLLKFRETFLNIDMMVIEELNELFFGLW